MKKIYPIIVLFGLASGCIRDPVRINKSIIVDNQSGHDITLSRFAKASDYYGDKNIDIKVSEKKEVFVITNSEKVDINNNNIAYWSNQNTDSVVVTFMGSIKVTHLNQHLQLNSRKNLVPFNDSRNILNPKNYKIVSAGGNYHIIYTFTEQDYLEFVYK